MTERLSVARGLRADLYLARLMLETIVEHNSFVVGMRFPLALWESQGHRLLGAVNAEAEDALTQAFCRLWGANGLIEAMARGTMSKEDVDGKPLFERVDSAIEVLDRLEGEYVDRETEYLGQRWPRLKSP